MRHIIFIFFWFLFLGYLLGQPFIEGNNICFRVELARAKKVNLSLSFKEENKFFTLEKSQEKENIWEVKVPLKDLKKGLWEYNFIVNKFTSHKDPQNFFIMPDTQKNAFILTANNSLVFDWESITDVDIGRIYLIIIWHFHQPYYGVALDESLLAPWVRAHSTKSYYNMPTILQKHPDIHCTINLSGSLLYQMQKYVSVLSKYSDIEFGRFDVKGYFDNQEKTDPWIDLMLKDTEKFSPSDLELLFSNESWNCFAIHSCQMERFPEYYKLKGKTFLSMQEKRLLKFFFFLSWFDISFFKNKVILPSSLVCDLTNFIEEKKDGKFYLRSSITEADCQRMIVEVYKVMASLIPLYKKLQYHPNLGIGQVEFTITPFHHPILPLLFSTKIAKLAPQSNNTQELSLSFEFPDDVSTQIIQSTMYFKFLFGNTPFGSWPGEGAVCKEIIPAFSKNGIAWIATDEDVLYNSSPNCLANQPYKAGYNNFSLAIFFRKNRLSNMIFNHQKDDEDKIILELLRTANYKEDHVVSLILDGENPFEKYPDDGHSFLNEFYNKLGNAQKRNIIITVTPSEYIFGNSKRGIPAHPVEKLKSIELAPGTWMNGSFDTWYGEQDENNAWMLLQKARETLEKSNIPKPAPTQLTPPKKETAEYYAWKAWNAIYIAESSDWYWWFGNDQNSPADKKFNSIFQSSLEHVDTAIKDYHSYLKKE